MTEAIVILALVLLVAPMLAGIRRLRRFRSDQQGR